MKPKLRKITVQNILYAYNIRHHYHETTKSHTSTLRIFCNGNKSTPLTINFITPDIFPAGNRLNTGIELFNIRTGKNQHININTPGFIKTMIAATSFNEWQTGTLMPPLDGIQILQSLGFDTTTLILKQ